MTVTHFLVAPSNINRQPVSNLARNGILIFLHQGPAQIIKNLRRSRKSGPSGFPSELIGLPRGAPRISPPRLALLCPLPVGLKADTVRFPIHNYSFLRIDCTVKPPLQLKLQ